MPLTKKKTASNAKRAVKASGKKAKKPTSLSIKRFLLKDKRLNKVHLIFFALVFALFGSFLIFKSMAGTVTLSVVEAETMALPAGSSVVNDPSASGTKALALYRSGTSTGSISLASAADNLIVRAKGDQCNGAPQLVVKIDGVQVQTASVSGSGWTDYATNISLVAGTHTMAVSFTNDYVYTHKNSRKNCDRNLYVDKVTFEGSAPEAEEPTAVSGNIAAGKPVKGDSSASLLERVTDGDLNTANYASMGSGPRWIQIDLGEPYAVSKVNLWHYFGDSRTYRDVAVQLSTTADFSSGTTTIFNNDKDNTLGLGAGSDAEYAETSGGKAITPPAAVNGRYVRLWSNGSSVNVWNHYVEAQVFGSLSTSEPAPEPTSPSTSTELLSETFTSPDGIFVSASAFWDNSDLGLSENANWFAEGGTMYTKTSTGWTDYPGFFRMWSRSTDLAFTKTEMDIRFNGFTGGTEGWHGINLWLNRKLRTNENGSRIDDGTQEGYVVDFLNRDGRIYILKKAGDAYYTLKQDAWKPETGKWYRWGGRVIDNGNGTNTIQMLVNGQVIQEVTDNGSTGGPRLTGGRTGLRSDYSNFNIDNLSITR